MSKGKIKVQTENIFPIIKKFLYSDNEIFLRELISNAVDATQKLKALASIGEFKGEIGDETIEVKLDKKNKTLTISDKGIGMTAEEVKKYINQIAFSGAEEFVEKYKDKTDANAIIGHFGLGFYSAFMVADKVEIFTKSYKNEPAAYWSCDGSPEYTLKQIDKKERGTDIVLHIAEDSTEFLEESRIQQLLDKYCKFMPVPIKFGTKKIRKPDPLGQKDEDGNVKMVEVEVDNIINITKPAWTKKPSELTDEDYKEFYRQLYPMSFDEPLFYIHLNVDYPFNLTGILYFPKVKNNMELQRNKIQLYSRQVFITDNVEGIVPDFLTLLHGVIDSPDIPLNVSRSYLQADANVKKISKYITKKVSDKLEEIFKKDRKHFEEIWNDIKVFIEYGMLTEEKFFERAKNFFLYKDTEGNYFTFDELKEKIKDKQTDKNGHLLVLYALDKDEQYNFIDAALQKEYKVVILDTPLTAHLVGKLEQTYDKTKFARVDADSIDKLIEKDEEIPSKLSDDEKEKVKNIFAELVDKEKFQIEVISAGEKENPVIITRPEFLRRMKDMEAVGGAGFYGSMPESYQLTINGNHPAIYKLLHTEDENTRNTIAEQLVDLAKLAQGMLKGEELNKFIHNSIEVIEKAEK